jgi:hypothetical protein
MRALAILFAILCIPFLVILSPLGPKEEYTKKNTSGTFHMKFGGAVCGEYIETACGITLRNCSDEKEYLCMHDVSVALDK